MVTKLTVAMTSKAASVGGSFIHRHRKPAVHSGWFFRGTTAFSGHGADTKTSLSIVRQGDPARIGSEAGCLGADAPKLRGRDAS